MNYSRSCFQRYNLIIPLLLAISFVPCGATAAFALDKPKDLKATYVAKEDKLLVEWGKAGGANKYKIVVVDPDGKTTVSSSTSDLKKKFNGSKFQRAVTYLVKVQSLSSSSKSKFATKNYIHVLSRASGKGQLLTLNPNGQGRTGSYYLPPKFGKKPRPLMIAFHGQDSDGLSIVNTFAGLAEDRGFIIIAPSSGIATDGSGTPTWAIGALPNSITDDFVHALNCIDEVLEFENVQVDPTRILAIGYSAGGAMSSYFATNSSQPTKFAELHGGIFPISFGDRRIPGWLSTGQNDPLRSPAEMQTFLTILTALGFNDLTSKVYDTNHGIAKAEKKDVVSFWLG